MNKKVKRVVMWGSITSFLVLGIQFFLRLLGGGFHERRFTDQQVMIMDRGGRHEFRSHQMMNGPHHYHDFSWIGLVLFLLLAFAIGIFIYKLLVKKGQANSINHFSTVATSFNTPVNRTNADILDKWEKNINKKENE